MAEEYPYQTTESKPPYRLVPLLILLALSVGCASSSTFQFGCDNPINDGLLLTVDLVQIDDAEERQIREVGEDWFYSDLRRQLGARTRTITVEGGCRQTVTVPLIKDYERLAVIADYQFEGRDRRKGQIEFLGKNAWRGKKLTVRVLNTYLIVTRDG